MMVDVLVILKNILEFIDFNNKTVIAVGAGGGQFAEYGKKRAGLLQWIPIRKHWRPCKKKWLS